MRQTLFISGSIKKLSFLLLVLLLQHRAGAQEVNCELRLYKTYQDYQQEKYTCWEVQDFRSLFFPRGRLKLKGKKGREKIIQENYWGCYLVYQGADGSSIKQLFRFHPTGGVALAYQESREEYAVFFALLWYIKKPLKVISRGLEPALHRVDEFQGVDPDGVRIILGRDSNGKWRPRAKRKAILNEIRAIRPSEEILKLRQLVSGKSRRR